MANSISPPKMSDVELRIIGVIPSDHLTTIMFAYPETRLFISNSKITIVKRSIGII